MKTNIPLIGVIGSSQASSPAKASAYDVGKQIIKEGFSLVCGGLGGIMESACKGAWDEAGPHSGRIIGILPGSQKSDANPYVDIAIATRMGYTRNMIIASTSDVIIAIEGGSGTLSELAMAWQFGKPIIVMEGLEGITKTFIGKRLDNRRKYHIESARNAEEALLKAKVWLGKME